MGEVFLKLPIKFTSNNLSHVKRWLELSL